MVDSEALLLRMFKDLSRVLFREDVLDPAWGIWASRRFSGLVRMVTLW
jgi:hypothetical protein